MLPLCFLLFSVVYYTKSTLQGHIIYTLYTLQAHHTHFRDSTCDWLFIYCSIQYSVFRFLNIPKIPPDHAVDAQSAWFSIM